MALQVWLPLNGTLENKGLSNVTVTNNGATVDNNGKIGKCYKSVGDLRFTIPTYSWMTFRPENSFSIALWEKGTATSSTTYIFACTAFELRKCNSTIYVGWGGAANEPAGYNATINESTWYHIAFTWDGPTKTLKLYVNGILRGTSNVTGNVPTSISSTLNCAYNGTRYLNDLRIYNHCLSAKEVKEISKGLILHYKLDGNDIGITIPRNGGLIPDGVELYDYILSSGTLWIDTGYLMNGDNYEINIDALQGTTSETIYGFLNTNQLCTLFLGDIYWNGSTYVGTNRSKRIGSDSIFISRFTLNIKANNGTINYKLNNTTGSYACGYTSFSGVQHNMHLFANNYYNNDHRYSTGKIYSFTIKLEGNLIRNFLPCTYLGEPGMWDTVENKFYRNQGTGQFTLGSKITLKEFEYLQPNSSAYIKTGYIPNSETKVISQFISPKLNTQPLFGGREAYQSNDFSFWPTASTDTDIRSNYNNDVIDYYYDISNVVSTVIKNKNILLLSNSRGNWDLVSPYATFTTPVEMYLFQINNNGTLLGPYTNGALKLYYLKIYNNGTLVRDFIPASYNGTPGLWDKVEWKFYANAGSGSFTLGPEKTVQQDAPIFYDSSGYCNHGSITGTLTTNNDSPRYTKSTQIVSGATISHPLCIKEPEWTCSCWIYPTSLSSYTYLNNLAMGMKITHGTQSLLYINENPAYYRYSHTFELNKWQHIVFVFKHSTRYMAIYKNGVKDIATGPSGGTVPGLSNTITLFTGFTGYVSDYREYCTALSEDDVKELYNTSAFVTNNGVFAEYELYEDNLSDVKKTGLLETANFYENGAESGYALDTDKTRVASNYIISEEFIEI